MMKLFDLASGQHRDIGPVSDRIEHIGQEIDHPDVDPRLFPGMMVAEENAELVDDPFYRAFIIAVRALESLAGCAR